MSKQTAIRLDEGIYERLQSLASLTNRTASFYMREAIEMHLEDLEDAYLADQAMRGLQDNKDQVVSAEEFWHGLDD